MLRFMLHVLQWNIGYLRHLDGSVAIDEKFVHGRHIQESFDGPRCDFVSRGIHLGSVRVPRHGHPFAGSEEALFPWGLTSPFSDMTQSEVGMAVGDILGRRFVAGTIRTTEMNEPDSLAYGLS